MTCHGPAELLADDLKAALARDYPHDRATGARPWRESGVRCRSSGHCKLAVNAALRAPPDSQDEPPEVEVVIEVPRGSFLKRGSSGRVDFVSPLPCPFNYGSCRTTSASIGDLLDALVLGPRLPFGTRIRVRAWGAVTLTDRGLSDDKLICSAHALTMAERRRVLCFFHYARCRHS